MRLFSTIAMAALATALLVACQTPGGVRGTSASASANAAADQMMYREVVYRNASQKGPRLVVLPGRIKSNNATFTQKVTTNNIADFGELELGKANFRTTHAQDNILM